MKITKVSQLTGKTNTLDLPVTKEQIKKYETGKYLIQDVFPELSRPEREFIKSGITPNEWEQFFGKQ